MIHMGHEQQSVVIYRYTILQETEETWHTLSTKACYVFTKVQREAIFLVDTSQSVCSWTTRL